MNGFGKAISIQEAHNFLIVGLQNAHALEIQDIELMERQVERLRNYPELEARMRQHIEETQMQVQRLDQVLSSLGTSASSLKDAFMSFMGNLMALAHTPAGDEIIKNTFANYAFENYEIASYRSLIAMAEATGQRDSVGLLQQTLREEEMMASWLAEHLRDVTLKYLSLEEQSGSGKR